MGKLNFCDPQKCLKNRSTNEIKNDQKIIQKSAPKMTKKVTIKIDEKSPDSYHKELPITYTE